MIQKNGDYYIYEDNVPLDKNNNSGQKSSLTQSESHQAVGNVKQRIQAIRQRFNQIKKQKLQFQQNQNNKNTESIFQKIKPSAPQNIQEIDIQVYIPDEILKLDQKLSQIEQKLKPNEILRRKIQSKGTLVERIKLLHDKLKSVLQKSSQIIVNNIQNYCSSLDDKEEYLKIMFLRQAHSKIKGMKQEIYVLEAYLKNLNQIQTKIKAVQPISKTTKTHSQIIQLRNNLSNKIKELFASMKNTYVQLLKQIDSIPV